jgi:hypothetical protein
MTFTYIGDLSTDLDQIRFKVSDTIEDAGVKPNGVNFTDEEINGLQTLESSVNRTVASLYETLAVTWANYIDTEIGTRDEKLSQIAKRYESLAKKWREDYGFSDSADTFSSGFVTRVDGYSDDIDSGQS